MNIAHQLLLEYIRDKEIHKSGHRLLQALSNDTHFNSNLETQDEHGKLNSLLDQLDQIDPTQNNQYVRWLIREYSRGSFKVEDSQRVQNVLKQFISVQKRLDKKDLNQYKFHDLEDTMDKIFFPDIDQSDDNEDFPDGTKVLYNGPLGWLVIPETEEASCELGKGTKWCTAADENNMFNDYSDDGPLYIWRDNQEGGAKYQFHFETRSFMDAKDRDLSTEKLNYFRTEHPVLKNLFKMKEAEIAKDPAQAYAYARDVIDSRWPEVEPAIAKDPEQAYAYALNIIRGRFPEGEPAIAKTALYAYEYAIYVIRGRFPEGEPVIAKNPSWAYEYASLVIKGRFTEGEPAIAKNPTLAYKYAKDIIKGRFPEGEPAIIRDASIAFKYAIYAIKGRFPEGEPAISKNPYWAYLYAKDVIKGRFPEAEAVIGNSEYASYYSNVIMHDPNFWEKINK